MTINYRVLNAETGLYRYLELLPAGTRITVHSKATGPRARTNIAAELQKERGFGDWQILSWTDAVSSGQLSDRQALHARITSDPREQLHPRLHPKPPP